MNILIIGSGGREHALAWKASQSPLAAKVFVAPGNAGTASEPNIENINIDPLDFEALATFAEQENVSLTIVGPEAPLVEGIVDFFETRNLAIFGPNKAAAQLEGSKSFTKDFLARHKIPTAAYQSFTDLNAALSYIDIQGAPIVIKADGLAAGKGVIVAETVDQAKDAVRDMLAGNAFGDAGARVVIEEFLTGEEASFIAICDGEDILPMASSQDHKRIGDGDTGLNTGGMGAYSPAPVVTAEVHQRIMEKVMMPTLQGMAAEGNRYSGFLYAGLMIDPWGEPKVIEFNCRFGDPETQPVMLRMQSDLVAHCLAATRHELAQETASWDQRSSLGVVLAAEGYPGSYQKGLPISGLNSELDDEEKIFQAGTKLEGDQVVTSGGRVICATALGDSVSEAQRKAYSLADRISWEGITMRRDIGYRAIDREQNS